MVCEGIFDDYLGLLRVPGSGGGVASARCLAKLGLCCEGSAMLLHGVVFCSYVVFVLIDTWLCLCVSFSFWFCFQVVWLFVVARCGLFPVPGIQFEPG